MSGKEVVVEIYSLLSYRYYLLIYIDKLPWEQEGTSLV
jgi:hypothetical protein